MEHHPGHCVSMMTDPPTTPPSIPPGELPHTGAGDGVMFAAIIGGLMIIFGSTLTLVVRRHGRK
jgi:LPXTG-motif cell wall-anchored protein